MIRLKTLREEDVLGDDPVPDVGLDTIRRMIGWVWVDEGERVPGGVDDGVRMLLESLPTITGPAILLRCGPRVVGFAADQLCPRGCVVDGCKVVGFVTEGIAFELRSPVRPPIMREPAIAESARGLADTG